MANSLLTLEEEVSGRVGLQDSKDSRMVGSLKEERAERSGDVWGWTKSAVETPPEVLASA
jgi:hypothetical protein